VERYATSRKCVPCRRAYKKACYGANLEKERARSRAQYRKSRGRANARRKAWRDANLERARAYRNARYAESPDEEKARSRAGNKARILASLPKDLRDIRAALYETNSLLYHIKNAKEDNQ